MDLEQRIEKLEEEMRHERTMRRFHESRLDAHDASFDAVREILKETASQIQQGQAEMGELRALVKELIQGLLKGRQNGEAS